MFKFDILYGSIFLLLSGIIAGVGISTSYTITIPTITYTSFSTFGNITIDSNAYWSIINNENTDITGLLSVAENASFFISSIESTIDLTVTLGSDSSFTNNGLIIFNSFLSNSAPTYEISSTTFTNNGDFYLVSGATSGSSSITFDGSLTNTGIMSFDASLGLFGYALFNAAITNSEQIYILNTELSQYGIISGTGCIILDNGSIFGSEAVISSSQQIYLADSASSITILSHSGTPTLAGFGNGNSIVTYSIYVKYSYINDTGILTIEGSSSSISNQEMYIGPGYDLSLFSMSPGLITYSGPPPNPVPAICQPYPGVPPIPGDYNVTTTITTTLSDGFIETDSEIIFLTFDDAGEEAGTTTSLFPTPNDPFTLYTTTFTTTDGNGYMATDSGIVIVTGYSDVSDIYTSTSLFPTSSDPETTYSTTFTTTDTNGYVATDSGVVVVTVDSSGTETNTSLFPTSSDPDTTYTTTFTTTDGNGYVATDSGVVVVTVDSSGTGTSTSLFPTSSDPATTYTTTFTTTDSNGYVATDSGVVVVSVDSSDTETSTSLFPTSSDPDTTYTTTFTATDSNGYVATDSGVVFVGAENDTTITSTSLFPTSGPESSSIPTIDLRVSSSGSSSSSFSSNYFNSSSSVGYPFTDYTTTFTSTESDGAIDTDSGVVIVSTYSDGSLYTSTSLYPTSISSSISVTSSTSSSSSSISTTTSTSSSSSATSSTSSSESSSVSSSSSYSSVSPSSLVTSSASPESLSTGSSSTSSMTNNSSPGSSSAYSTSNTSSTSNIASQSSNYSTSTTSSASTTLSTSTTSSLSSTSLSPTTSSSGTFASTSSSSSLTISSSFISSYESVSSSSTTTSPSLVASSSGTSLSSSTSPSLSNSTLLSSSTLGSSFSSSSESSATTVSSSLTTSSSSSSSVTSFTPSSTPPSPFTAIDSIDFKQAGSILAALPLSPLWTATLAWQISDEYNIGDTFSLILPNVLGIYNANYGTTKRDIINSIYLEADGVNYAECIAAPGSLDSVDSLLQCTILEVPTSFTTGTIEIPLVFNVGGSSSASDLEAANSLGAGTQSISFTTEDGKVLSYDVTFDAGSPSPDDPEDVVFAVRTLEWDSTNAYYLLGGNCPTSYGFGKLSLTVDDGTLNCDTWEAKITNDLNDWYLPKSAQSFGSISLESCSGNEIVINYANVPAGYRVFLDVIGSPDGFNIGATYSDEHICGAAVSTGSSSTFVTTNSAGATITGTAVVVVTSDITVTVTEPCSQYGTTIITTLLNGEVTTETAEVIISTNSGGSLYTTTSIIAGPTEYTTTIVTTDIVGVPCTETGVVIVSSSEGELYTITSVRGGGGTTVYTTTVITTDTIGVPCTETAIVIVSNSAGTLVTTIIGGGVVVDSEPTGSPEIGESVTETIAAQSTTEPITVQNASPETYSGSATPGSPAGTSTTVAAPSISPKYENTSSNNSLTNFMFVASVISLLMTFIFS